MKVASILMFIIVLCSVLIPFFVASSSFVLQSTVPVTDDTTQQQTTGDTVSFSNVTTPANASSFDNEYKVKLKKGDEVTEISLKEYLIGVVSAEMPAKFEAEALKAQAIAARTYFLYKLNSPSVDHPEADICSDSACCAAFKSDDELHEKWGNSYETFSEKIRSAVEGTDGIYISYEEAPALAVFHSSSSGSTETSSAVWNKDLPYLKSVKSPESAKDVPNFISSVTISASEFKETIQKKYPDADFSVSPLIDDIVYTESGRVSSLSVGEKTVSGTEFRSLFSLRSTCFSVSQNETETVIASVGYGHGVGMSQYGANVMAEEGSICDEILSWYYPGTKLKNANEK